MRESITDRDVGLMRILDPLQPAAFRLALFPHPVGTPDPLWRLIQLLLPSVEVLTIQYPGSVRQGTHGYIGNVVELVHDSTELLRDWTDLPLALFGHRGGGEFTLQTAARLEQETQIRPLCTFVADWGSSPKFETVKLNSPVVALAGGNDATELPRWRECTTSRFDLEVWPGGGKFLDTHCEDIANLIHDRLVSASIE